MNQGQLIRDRAHRDRGRISRSSTPTHWCSADRRLKPTYNGSFGSVRRPFTRSWSHFEKAALIAHQPGVPRSIALLVDRKVLPELASRTESTD